MNLAVGSVSVFSRSVFEAHGGGGGGGGGLNLPDERGQLCRGGPLAREENLLPLRRSLQRRSAVRVSRRPITFNARSRLRRLTTEVLSCVIE